MLQTDTNALSSQKGCRSESILLIWHNDCSMQGTKRIYAYHDDDDLGLNS